MYGKCDSVAVKNKKILNPENILSITMILRSVNRQKLCIPNTAGESFIDSKLLHIGVFNNMVLFILRNISITVNRMIICLLVFVYYSFKL